MKILFIYPTNDPSYPLQIGALSAYLKEKRQKTALLLLVIKNSLEKSHFGEIKKAVDGFKPDFVAFSCYEMAFPWVKKIATYLKKNWPEVRVLVGGYYPTLAPEEVIAFPAVDVVCLGEGEEPLAELCRNKKTNYKIKNLWFKQEGRIIKNPVRPLIENLDRLPFPDREMLDYQEHLNLDKKGERNVKVMASRGCPFECTYCSNKYFRSIYPNQTKYLRLRSPENVIEELRRLKLKYEFEKVGFHDDNLTLDVSWLKKFAELYQKEIALPFYGAARPESCTDEVLNTLKKAGCELLLIGVESGDERYRARMMKRLISNQTIIEAFKRVREKGLLTWSFTMVGLPFEDHRMLLKTWWLNWRCRPDFIMASIFYPLKGTEFGNLCYQNDWVDLKKKEKVNSYAWESILKHPTLSPLEIRLAKYLNSLAALRSKFFWKIFKERLVSHFKHGSRI